METNIEATTLEQLVCPSHVDDTEDGLEDLEDSPTDSLGFQLVIMHPSSEPKPTV